MTQNSPTMSHKQLAMIQVAKRQLGLAEDEYRGLLRRMGGVESARDLTPSGFDALIRAFEMLGFQRISPPRPVRRGMATPSQLALIEKLWRDYAGENSEGDLRHWLERSYKISALRFMTRDHAAMAINGLHAMTRRKTSYEALAKKSSGAA